MTIRDFQDLVVWQKAMTLAEQVYLVSRRFPRDERYGLTSQVRRAVVSVSANIAEGHARQGREFLQFLSIAQGSLAETHCQLLLARRLKYFSDTEWQQLLKTIREVRRLLCGLRRKLKSGDSSQGSGDRGQGTGSEFSGRR